MRQNVSKCLNVRRWLTCTVVGLLCWPEVGAAAGECNAAHTTRPDQIDFHVPLPFDGRSLDNWMTLDGNPVTRSHDTEFHYHKTFLTAGKAGIWRRRYSHYRVFVSVR